MNLAAEILVIILSIFLAIFLIVGIVLFVYLIKLTKQIRSVAQSAEKAAGDIESIVSRVAKVTSPMFLAEIVNKIINLFKKDKEKEEK